MLLYKYGKVNTKDALLVCLIFTRFSAKKKSTSMYDIFYYNILQYVIVFVRVYYCMYITYAKLNDRNGLYVHYICKMIETVRTRERLVCLIFTRISAIKKSTSMYAMAH